MENLRIYLVLTLLSLLLTTTFRFATAQTTITLSFAGRDSLTQDIIALDSVHVKNLTENCDSTVYGAAPVLTITALEPIGIDETEMGRKDGFGVYQNYPNPFSGTTFVNIFTEKGGPVNLLLLNSLGSTLASYANTFEPGLHSFLISATGHSVLTLMAGNASGRKSIKILSAGKAQAGFSIQYAGLLRDAGNNYLKATTGTGFIYYLGNQLAYTAYSDGFIEKTLYDSPVTDYTYYFDMQKLYAPTVTTDAVTEITQSTATCGGNVTEDGGMEVTARGVCWATSPGPTTNNSHTLNGSGLGAFVSYLINLEPNTPYYVRAYATNSIGTAYGNEVSFTTGQAVTTPVVTTAPVTNITQTTATSGGTVTSDGGASVTARGVCWGTTPNPTLAGSYTTDGSGTGTFVSNLSGLTGGTVYYIRAYATNMLGTSYGNELTFTTLDLPTVTTATVTDITATTATSGGNVTSDGGAAVTARGVCWSTTPNPTLAGSYTTDGSGTGTFVSNLTGLTGGTDYYIRAYATNMLGTSYGNELTFTTLDLPTVTTAAVTDITATTATSGGNVTSDGGAAVTARGVCWSTNANPTTAGSHTADGTGTGTFVSNLTGLTGSTLYYVRAYATNSVGTSYGNELTFTTQSAGPQPCPGIPTVTYEGKTYNTVLIGTQCWFKENLNVGTMIIGTQNQANNSVVEKYCYNNLETNCDTYGGLYQWNEVMQYGSTAGTQGICPPGWHIPTTSEWTTLAVYLGGSNVAGGKMKESGTTHWASPNTGATNSSGFTALPGGNRYINSNFSSLTTDALFHSSSLEGRHLVNWGEFLSILGGNSTMGISCRCIKD